MTVTKLLQVSKLRTKVYLDEEIVFLLSVEDIRRYQIAEGRELSAEMYDGLVRDTLLPEAKKKAMRLLLRSDETEHNIRQKLLRVPYPASVVEETVAYLYGYHYLDDRRYASHYMELHGDSMSRQEICRYLRQQGIAEDVTDHLYEAFSFCEDDILYRQMEKRLSGKPALTEKERNRHIRYFLRKGFSYPLVCRTLRRFTQGTADFDDMGENEW